MSFTSDDDLFRPSLTEPDDPEGFDRPWNPWLLVVLAFFFGLIAGGGLLALNYQRLGIHGRCRSTLILIAATYLVISLLSVGLLRVDLLGLSPSDSAVMVFGGTPLISGSIAGVLAASQQSRYGLFQRSRLSAGKLLGPAVLAVALSVVVELVRMTVFFLILLPFNRAARL